MTDDPINLDGRRSSAGRHDSEMRRRPANTDPDAMPSQKPHPEDLDARMLAEPARNWSDLLETCRFLLGLYAATPEAGDERIQELIGRALDDMNRLARLEEEE
jgi:hypothetical protein